MGREDRLDVANVVNRLSGQCRRSQEDNRDPREASVHSRPRKTRAVGRRDEFRIHNFALESQVVFRSTATFGFAPLPVTGAAVTISSIPQRSTTPPAGQRLCLSTKGP